MKAVGDAAQQSGHDVQPESAPRHLAVALSDGAEVEAQELLLATGRAPRTDGLGLDTAGIELNPRGGLDVDEHCSVTDGLWALGDVTGVALFTHVAKYQGRIVADNILGTPRQATYSGIPRVVFAQPEIAAVGLTPDQARQRGLDIATTELDLADSIARPWTYETDPAGTLGLISDRARRTLVGAWAIAPQAGEWIHTAALAIRGQIPIDTLLDGVAQYPTYAEAYLAALEHLDM